MNVYWIPNRLSARLGIMARPRAGDWLFDEITSLQQQEVGVLVSLLESEEVAELGLGSEESVCRSLGIQFLRFPIPDRSVPAETEAAIDFIHLLDELLRDGKHVVIHCRAGIGRSSLIAAGLLLLQGTRPAHAFSMIAQARRYPVPDTAEQVAWFESMARSLDSYCPEGTTDRKSAQHL